VITSELPASLALIWVVTETSGCRSFNSWRIDEPNRHDCVTMRSLTESAPGSLPESTGFLGLWFVSTRCQGPAVADRGQLFWTRNRIEQIQTFFPGQRRSLLQTSTLARTDNAA